MSDEALFDIARGPDDELLIAAYQKQGRTLDDLPYTEAFETIYQAACPVDDDGRPTMDRAAVFRRLHNLRKAGKLPRAGRVASSPPRIDAEAERLLVALVEDRVGRISKRDQLLYSEAFDAIVERFNEEAGLSLSPHDLWRIVARLAKAGHDAINRDPLPANENPLPIDEDQALDEADHREVEAGDSEQADHFELEPPPTGRSKGAAAAAAEASEHDEPMRESAMHQSFYAKNTKLPSRVTLPPGDDMGAVRIASNEVLVSTDQLIDGVHFRLHQMSLERIGRKAVMRSVSDIAAMAARPIGCVATGCLPRVFGKARADRLFEAMRRAAAECDCPLFGGDLAVWEGKLVLTVTVLAEDDGIDPVRREGAAIGDVICVSGALGGSGVEVDGYLHHTDFVPRIELARRIARECRPTAMMDLSDGLARDLPRMLPRGASARLLEERLPASTAARKAAQKSGKALWEHIVGDGEDYELLFTVSTDRAGQLPDEINGVPLTCIGTVERADPQGPTIIELDSGKVEPLGGRGWEHEGQ